MAKRRTTSAWSVVSTAGSGAAPGSDMPRWAGAGGVVAWSSGAATGVVLVVVVVVDVEVVSSAARAAPPTVSAIPANNSPIACLSLFMGGIVDGIVSSEQLLGNAPR